MSAELIAGSGDILLLCDHASNAVPDDIDLGIDPALLDRHIAVDIGAGPLTRQLAAALHARAVLGTVSRLVIDVHREPDHPGLIPQSSDGHPVPGNAHARRAERIVRFHGPYHRAIAAAVRHRRPALIVAIHSFTPRLESDGADRPWQVGILSNRDRRAADLALTSLAARDVIVGDNEPYSGRRLNTTLNRHAEANGIPSISVEVRNDLIGDTDGPARWCEILAASILDVRDGLAQQCDRAT